MQAHTLNNASRLTSSRTRGNNENRSPSPPNAMEGTALQQLGYTSDGLTPTDNTMRRIDEVVSGTGNILSMGVKQRSMNALTTNLPRISKLTSSQSA